MLVTALASCVLAAPIADGLLWLSSVFLTRLSWVAFLEVPYLSSALFLWNIRLISGANSASASTTTPTQA
jgi:hypothetical protein